MYFKFFKKISAILICIFSVMAFFSPANVYAADAVVVFGSDSYENESGAEFPVGVYVSGDSEIGYYRVEISYDPMRLEYLEGATSEENGIILFEGNGNSDSVSTMLRFRALSGGETELKISDASVRVSGTDSENFNLTELATVTVTLSGEDTAAQSETQTTNTDETVTPEETSEAETAQDETSATESEAKDSSANQEGIAISPAAVIVPLIIALGVIISILLGRRASRKKRIRKEYIQKVKEKRASKPNEAATQVISNSEVAPVKKVESNPKPETAVQAKNEPKSEAASAAAQAKGESKPEAVEQAKNEANVVKDAAQSKDEPVGEAVIQVKNVSMEFKVSNANTSGLKDYMIQKMKGKLKYRKLKALDDISFNVYKGEVVGIIGTNGSGKSTLLKIVSGALYPSEGEVIADKQKIQLLTLGTGFDGELSARENVYLNGAIIGYTKEFIDKHYDEIVEFAELQDFMEEKVKNFSSGMVSRLGFSIATVAGAAEILILDEVLSVGDQFFRKKSLERIKQMIHGGSTVLIVSHGMGTIRQHCTKVVWIEKGKLKMVGKPAEVCEAYTNQMNEIKANDRGELGYYIEGELQRDYSGYVKNSRGDSVMVKEGMVDTSFTFAKWIDKKLVYFVKGVADNSYTGIAITEAKSKVYFKDGVFRPNFCGILPDADNKMLYFNKGVFDPKFSGEKDGYKVEKGIATKIEAKPAPKPAVPKPAAAKPAAPKPEVKPAAPKPAAAQENKAKN